MSEIFLWVLLGLCSAALIWFGSKEFLRNKHIELKAVFAGGSEKNLNNLFGISKAAFLSTAVSLIVIFITFLSFIETSNQNKQTALINKESLEIATREFQLKTRPYVTVSDINGRIDYLAKSTSFALSIINSGNVPARIISQSLKCLPDQVISTITKGDLIGINQHMIYDISIQGYTKGRCTLDIKYRNAIEGLSVDEYETQQDLIYEFGKPLSSGGGFMR